jgi:hypothetical protein
MVSQKKIIPAASHHATDKPASQPALGTVDRHIKWQLNVSSYFITMHLKADENHFYS